MPALPERFADALQNSEIKRGARAIAQALARSDGASTAAEIVEHLARPCAATSNRESPPPHPSVAK
jgi:UDP:flavonoid glycosyltransferase YjiC (YdhE family)